MAADRGPWHGSHPPARESRDHEPDQGGAASYRYPGGDQQGKEPPVRAERTCVGLASPRQGDFIDPAAG